MSPELSSSETNPRLLQSCVLALVLIGLFFTTHVNYLLFHTLAELFSIVVAFSIFTITWHSRRFLNNSYLLLIGIAYLFIGFLDLLHTLTYKGMPIFTAYDYYANQLWIATRYLESLTLLGAFIFARKQIRLDSRLLFGSYLIITALLVASIFYWKIFPVCFVEGVGLTPFKKISEYIISALLLVCIGLLHKNRELFETRIYHLLLASLICTILSELAFTFYISNYGLSNLIGHYLKIFSFYLIHICIVQTGIEAPYQLIFSDLNRTNQKLSKEIEKRQQVQHQNEELISELQEALNEIKSLQGIIPICASCKKIKDDQGYWNELEQYIETHADVQFSHGLCASCADKLYAGQAWYESTKNER